MFTLSVIKGPFNPYHPGHYSGGSSSGSAVAVAVGLAPIGIGFDGILPFTTIQFCEIHHNIIQYNTKQYWKYNTIQYNVIQ